MDLTYIFVTAFVVGLSGAMMPGPLLTVTITEAARRGAVAGPLLMLGHAILEAVLVIALVLGLGAFLTRPVAGITIAIVGGVFLMWMGFQMARDAVQGKVELAGDGKGIGDEYNNSLEGRKSLSPVQPVITGILVSLSNPLWSLWWATIGLGYITISLEYGVAGTISFFSGHILADMGWYSLVAAGVAGGRRFMGLRAYKGLIIVCGIFLVALGVSFVFYGLFGASPPA